MTALAKRLVLVQSVRVDDDTCSTSRIELLTALQGRGWDVTLVAGVERGAGPVPALPFRLIPLPQFPVPVLRQVWNLVRAQWILFRLVAGERAGHVLMDPVLFAAAFPMDVAARLGWTKTRFTLDIRSGLFHRRLRPWTEALRQPWLRLAIWYGRTVFGHLTTISIQLKDILVDRFRVPAGRVGIWESGVAPAHFTPEGSRADFPPARDGFVVMYHGTLGVDRGLPEAVSAMAALQDLPVTFVIIGDGVERATLQRLIAEQGLSRVHLLPPVPYTDIPRWIRICDVGLIPLADTEVMRSSSPLKLFEYLAVGRPVIISGFESFRKVLDGSRAALFIDDNRPGTIAAAIRLAYEQRAVLAREAEAAREDVSARHSWDRRAAQLESFLLARETL